MDHRIRDSAWPWPFGRFVIGRLPLLPFALSGAGIYIPPYTRFVRGLYAHGKPFARAYKPRISRSAWPEIQHFTTHLASARQKVAISA